MATVTGLTAARMLAIEAATIVDGEIDASSHLILDRHDGAQIDAGLIASKILSANALPETAPPTSYPVGVSMFSVTTGSGWSLANGFGSVITNRPITDRTSQTFFSASGGTGRHSMWTRTYHSTTDGGGWTAWAQVQIMHNLSPASLTQSSPISSYPQGSSRVFFSTTESSGWDFAGKTGEVETFRDGDNYARQTWTRHFGGLTNLTETWVRTANQASGWCKWLTIAEDTGWVNFSVTGGATIVQQPAYRRRNGIVFLKGTLQVPNGGFTTIANLPNLTPKVRPQEDKVFPITSNTTVQMSARLLASDGAIQSWTSASTTAWFTLAGISYPID
jgi:hypothetical protein